MRLWERGLCARVNCMLLFLRDSGRSGVAWETLYRCPMAYKGNRWSVRMHRELGTLTSVVHVTFLVFSWLITHWNAMYYSLRWLFACLWKKLAQDEVFRNYQFCFLFFCVCVCVYLWWWLYSYMFIYACLCAGHRIASGISSIALCRICWVRISCRTYRFPFQLHWLAINNREPSLLRWSCKSSVIPSFYVDAGDTNSVPQAFLASLLPTHPSL